MVVVALPKVKEDFANIVESITLQPWTLMQFIVWLDLKLAEYKINGYMVLDQSFGDIPDWLANIALEAPDEEKGLDDEEHGLMSQLSKSMSHAQDDDSNSNDIKILPITSDALSPPRAPPSPVHEASGYRRSYKQPPSIDYTKLQRMPYTGRESPPKRSFVAPGRKRAQQTSFSPVISQVFSEAKYRRVASTSQPTANTPVKSVEEPIMIADDDAALSMLSHDGRRASLESGNRDTRRVADDAEQDRLTFSEPRHRPAIQPTHNDSNTRDLAQRLQGDSNSGYVNRTMGSNLNKRAVSSTISQASGGSSSGPGAPPYLDINMLNADAAREQPLAAPHTSGADPVPTQMFANSLRGQPSTSSGQAFSHAETSYDELSTTEKSSHLSTDADGEISIKTEPDTDASMGNVVCGFPATVDYPLLHQDRDGPTQYISDVICPPTRTKWDALTFAVSHLGVQKYQCPACDEKLNTIEQLQAHRLKHSAPYKCNECSNEYQSPSGLYRHRAVIHERRRPHRCQICGKTFTRKANFDGHMNIHNNKKPFVCEHCGEAYAFKSSLCKHQVQTCQRKRRLKMPWD